MPKIESGDRRAKREQVIKLAQYLHQDEKEMLTLWLADKVLDAVEGEERFVVMLSSLLMNISRQKNKYYSFLKKSATSWLDGKNCVPLHSILIRV